MRIFYVQHGSGTAGPFRTESVEAREDWKPQARKGGVTACRFLVKYNGRWHRLYSQQGMAFPHFIRSNGERLIVTGVCP
jgi:hypothetical protein